MGEGRCLPLLLVQNRLISCSTSHEALPQGVRNLEKMLRHIGVHGGSRADTESSFQAFVQGGGQP